MFSQAVRHMYSTTLQVVNYSHLFPTRYSLELEGLKGTVSADSFKEPTQREDSKKQVKKLLEDRYTNGKNKWFFQPLRVCDITRTLTLLLTIYVVLISYLCCVTVSRKATCTPHMSPIIYALHSRTHRSPDSNFFGYRRQTAVYNVSQSSGELQPHFYTRDSRASTNTRSGMLSMAPCFSTHIPAA
jgi:Ribosomal L27e protein family